MEKAREVEAAGEVVAISRSLALPMCQGEEGESGKGKHKTSLPSLLRGKEKKRAQLATPKIELKDEEKGKNKEVHCLATAIEASKAVPHDEDLASLSQQPKVPQDIEWGAKHPATYDVLFGKKPESWEPRQGIEAR
ncbi:hypothetical protein C0993_005107, partial [Termitomyces sp. T159_Od127]